MLNDEEVEGIDTASTQVRHPLWANVELRRLHGGENMAEGQGEAIDDEEPPMDEGADRAEHGLEG
jgi:RNA polymerase II-associated factor 1